MDLDIAVLAIGDKRACLLTQTGEAIESREAAFDQIQAITCYTNLLQAGMRLLLRDGSQFVVNYNAVSRDKLEAVVAYLRSKLPTKPQTGSAVIAFSPILVSDYFFQNLMAEQLRLNAQIQVVHCENPGLRCRNELGRSRRTLGILILDSGQDLVLIGRGKSMRRSREAIYVQQSTYIPYAAIQSHQFEERAAGKQGVIPSLRLQLAGHSIAVDLWESTENLTLLLTGRK